MNEHDKNFLKNMSPLLIAAMVMFFMLVAYETKADDHNYTEHGIKITSEDLAVDTINISSIKRYKWNKTSKTLTLTLISNKLVDVKFSNRCWDIQYASALQFNSWAGTTFIGKGDNITPIGWTNKGKYPCTIKSMYLAVEEE